MQLKSDHHSRLLQRIRWLIGFFIFGLVISGATAIPLETELNWLVNLTGARTLVEASGPTAPPVWAEWLCRVQTALHETNLKYPFIGYGGDWLAFGHFVIALAFVAARRDPVRNRWLFDFGLLACALVIPYALVCGAFRGIPFWWRLIDCSFGLFGAIPLWYCRQGTMKLQSLANSELRTQGLKIA